MCRENTLILGDFLNIFEGTSSGKDYEELKNRSLMKINPKKLIWKFKETIFFLKCQMSFNGGLGIEGT